MTPRLSVIIPTCGRPSLVRTIASIEPQLRASDNIVVVGDGPHPESVEMCRTTEAYYCDTRPTNNHGNAQRQHGMTRAVGDVLLFLDDDDIYLPGALDCVRVAVEASPGRIVLMRYLDNRGDVLWKDPVVMEGNIGTPSLVIPNRPAWLGQWGDRYEGDYDFLRSTLDTWPDGEAGIVWCTDVIADCRPQHLSKASHG